MIADEQLAVIEAQDDAGEVPGRPSGADPEPTTATRGGTGGARMVDNPLTRGLSPVGRRIESLAERFDADPAVAGLVRWARERLPGEDLAIDPLALGPGLATDLAVRLAPVAAHRPSVLRELGLTALQLWQAQHRDARPAGPTELAVLFTDIAGFSDWTLEVGDETALAALSGIAEVVEPAVSRDGTLIKRLGDGLMAVFPDPVAALAAARDTRDAVDRLELTTPGSDRLRQRAGLHLGRPVFDGGDYFGRDVNVAARVADCAAGGEICLSDTLWRSLPTDTELRFEQRAGLDRKGVPDEVEVYVTA